MGGATEPDKQGNTNTARQCRSIQASLRANQSAKARADGTDELEQLQLELLVIPAIAPGCGSNNRMDA